MLAAVTVLAVSCGSSASTGELSSRSEPSTTVATTAEGPTDTKPAAGSGDPAVADRLVAYLLADMGDLDATESDVRCVADRLGAGLTAVDFELMTTNLETLDEVEDGNQFSAETLMTISTGFADCLDFDELADEFANELGDPTVASCLVDELGQDRVEALMLFEVLGDSSEGRGSPLLLAGLDGPCNAPARSSIENSILDQFPSEEQGAIDTCFASIADDELRPFLEGSKVFDAVAFVGERCA